MQLPKRTAAAELPSTAARPTRCFSETAAREDDPGQSLLNVTNDDDLQPQKDVGGGGAALTCCWLV